MAPLCTSHRCYSQSFVRDAALSAKVNVKPELHSIHPAVNSSPSAARSPRRPASFESCLRCRSQMAEQRCDGVGRCSCTVKLVRGGGPSRPYRNGRKGRKALKACGTPLRREFSSPRNSATQSQCARCRSSKVRLTSHRRQYRIRPGNFRRAVVVSDFWSQTGASYHTQSGTLVRQ